MKIGRTMPQRNSEKEPITFFDIAACFTKEEWGLLHEWQTEIYRNVMTEIHEALTSLGPRIATSVFTLRAKEDDDSGVGNHHGFEKKPGISPSTRILTFDTDILPRKKDHLGASRVDCVAAEGDNSIDPLPGQQLGKSNNAAPVGQREETKGLQGYCRWGPKSRKSVHVYTSSCYPDIRPDMAHEIKCEAKLNSPDRSDVRDLEISNSISKGFAIRNTDTVWKMGNVSDTFPGDYCSDERADVCNSTSSDSGYGVVRFTIKEEEDKHPIEIKESIDYLAGFETEGVIQEEDSITFTKKKALFNASSRKTNDLHCSAKGEDARNSVWQECNLEGQTKDATKHGSDLHQNTLLMKGSGKTSAPDSNLWNTTYCTLPANPEETHGARACTELTTQETHTREKLYPCAECEKRFSLKRHLIIHQRSHKEQREQPFQCIQCQKRFSEKCNLVIHMRTHTGERPFQCTQCEKRFSIKSNLVKHQRLHFRERPAKEAEVRNSQFQESNLEGQTTAAIKHRSDLHLDTILIERSAKTSAPESNLWNTGFFTHPLNTHQTHGTFTCTELTGDIETHSKDKPYHCADCEKQFSFKRNLIRHQRTHEEQRERPFQCIQCQKSFSEKCNLVIHMRTHTGERPFQCTECEKRFSIKANLVTHQRLHSRERPYQCPECEKSFNQKSHLISHMTKHT